MATQGHKLLVAGATVSVMEPVLALAHTGPLGVIVGLALGAAAYIGLEDIEAVAGKELFPARPPCTTEVGRRGHPSAMQRLLVGKSMRMQADHLLPDGDGVPSLSQDTEEEGCLTWGEAAQEETLTPPRLPGQVFEFSEVLKTFQPAKDRIFLARTQDGKDVFCAAKDLCHVAVAGNTGGGKSSIQRMLMLQLCKARMNVLWLNPHYTRFDLENGEDWTPFDPYLLHPPMECRKYAVIEHYLKHMALDLIPQRMERRAQSLPLGKPYFIFLDELPAIIRTIPDAPKYMRVILEEGRKVGIFLIVASQDFLVKTINPDGGGGSIRECYRTAYYVGGDATTGRTMLDMPAKLIPEAILGKGSAMVRGAPQKEAKQSLVPYVRNETLYRELGPSTFQPSRQEEAERELDELQSESEGTEKQRTTILDTLLHLVQTDQLDDKKLAWLIEQLPVQREEPERSEPQVQPLSPLEQAVQAYEEGADTLVKLANALSVSEWKARNLMAQVQEDLKRRACVSSERDVRPQGGRDTRTHARMHARAQEEE